MFCQSCTLPIDDTTSRGTEKDGSKSSTYCKYCYQDGAFTSPGMTMEGMTAIIKEQMKKTNLPEAIVQKSLEMLPYLKRWQKIKV